MSRRGAGLSLLITLALLLQLAAGVGLAYVAGFSQVSAALGNIRWVWLFALVGALFVSFAGYYCAYQGIFRVEEGPTLSRRHMRAVVVAGFGGFFAHGRGALDQYALEAAGASRRDAQVRATALAGLEHGVLAVGVCGAAIAVLASGLAQPSADTTVPWAIIPVPGFLVAFWAAGRYRAKFRDHAGWRGVLAAFLDSVYLIRVLFLRPYRWAPALLGMALFWAAEAFAAWAALAALGVEMSVAALIVGFGTGMVFTRRTGPLGGAGVLVLVLPPALWYSGAPLAAAVAGVFIYQVLFLWLPMPVALTLLPTLRAMGVQRGPLAVHHEAGITDYGRQQAQLPSQPAPVAVPHRALGSPGLSRPGRASGERRRRSHAQSTDQGREDLSGTPRPRRKQGESGPDRECSCRQLSQPGGAQRRQERLLRRLGQAGPAQAGQGDRHQGPLHDDQGRADQGPQKSLNHPVAGAAGRMHRQPAPGRQT
jgi:uncharacterized membrane protein YbhN (UPF0104 family)